MRRFAVKFSVALLTLLVGLFIYRSFSYEPSHFWSELRGAQVTYMGHSANSAKVYLSPDGKILIDLIESGDGLYLVIPEKNYIGMPNRSNFYELPGMVYSKEVSPPTAGPGKMEMDPNLKTHEGLIEFMSLSGAGVRVVW